MHSWGVNEALQCRRVHRQTLGCPGIRSMAAIRVLVRGCRNASDYGNPMDIAEQPRQVGFELEQHHGEAVRVDGFLAGALLDLLCAISSYPAHHIADWRLVRGECEVNGGWHPAVREELRACAVQGMREEGLELLIVVRLGKDQVRLLCPARGVIRAGRKMRLISP